VGITMYSNNDGGQSIRFQSQMIHHTLKLLYMQINKSVRI